MFFESQMSFDITYIQLHGKLTKSAYRVAISLYTFSYTTHAMCSDETEIICFIFQKKKMITPWE